MELSVRSLHDGSTVKSITVSERVFDAELNEGLLHQAVVAFQAAGRAGTAAQKTRAEVSGGGRKPWKQKGTGRARAGTTRGPIWRKGGVTFAAKPRDYTKKINKKMYRAALRCCITQLQKEGRLVVVSDFSVESINTKAFKKVLDNFTGASKYLIALNEAPINCELSARNIPCVIVGALAKLHLPALLHSDCIIVTEEAILKLEEILAK